MADLSALPAVGLRTLSALLDIDRDTIRAALSRADLKPICNRGGHPQYAMADALRALFARRGEIDPALLTPTDRRALADAKLRELELERRRGELLPREDVRTAAATAFATVAQSVRAIPDRLEKAGLDPEMADRAAIEIDAMCDDLAEALQAMHDGGKPR